MTWDPRVTKTVAARERNALTPPPRAPKEGDFCVCGGTFISVRAARNCGLCGRSPQQSENVQRRALREQQREVKPKPQVVDVRSETVGGLAYHTNHVGDPA